MRALDLVGVRFGLLQVVRKAQAQPVLWLCVCDCGSNSVVSTGRLRSGNTKSCGCKKRSVLGKSTTVHGLHGTRTYRIWKAMHTRCKNPNSAQFKDYGGRGISVCPQWDRFTTFLADMGLAPPDGSIDRVDNNGNYEPGNCRWATRTEQNRNARSNIRVAFEGVSYVAAELARKHGVSKSVAYSRMKRGWSTVDACTKPPRPIKRGTY